MKLFHILIAGILLFPSGSEAAELTSAEYEELINRFIAAQGLEKTDLQEARRIYSGIYEKHPDTIDPNSEVTFVYGWEAKQRIKVIDCKLGNSTNKIESLNDFLETFSTAVSNRNHESLAELIDCDFTVGKAETDNEAIANPQNFSKSIFRSLNIDKLSYEKIRASNIYSFQEGNESSSILIVQHDNRKAALYLDRLAPYSFRHAFVFELLEGWKASSYHTADDEVLQSINF